MCVCVGGGGGVGGLEGSGSRLVSALTLRTAGLCASLEPAFACGWAMNMFVFGWILSHRVSPVVEGHRSVCNHAKMHSNAS